MFHVIIFVESFVFVTSYFKLISMNRQRKSVFSWCLYDWANTAFSTVIITFVFGVYFAREIVGDEVAGAAQWASLLE